MNESPSLSGLSDDAAREFHKVFMNSFILFFLVALVAHVLVWVGIGGWINPAIGG
jgi:light-harvesting complex 1 beta chain